MYYLILFYKKASIPPVIYSSDPTHSESTEQENEIDSNDIKIHTAYAWRTGPFGEVNAKHISRNLITTIYITPQ